MHDFGGEMPGIAGEGGDMGRLMRSFDWSNHALGDPSTWPQSLRTAVSIMLDSGFAMVVAWGPDYRFLYNDRYQPVLGSKHPASLGRAAREIFPEVWDFIGPLFDKTRTGESVAVDDCYIPLERNGYLESCWFTLSYSPIRDESGGVGGMLAVVAETTERVEGERRLKTLRDLAAAREADSAEQACVRAGHVLADNPTDVPFALLYLLDGDGKTARRVSAVRVDGPALVALDDPAALWPLAAARKRAVVVDGLDLPGGPYPERAHTALVLPLRRAGHDTPYGFFVAGVCPRRALDDAYRTFFELARDHMASAIARAEAFAEEAKRAEALAAIDRVKTVFFSNVSHELRTPLTLLLGPAHDALEHPASLSPAERGRWELVQRNARRLQKLVNGLLDFSRIEAGRIEASYRETDVAAVTVDLLSQFRSAFERAGLSLDVDAAGQVRAYVDREMWEKIVLNLVSNAFKHTFTGGVSVSVRARDGAGGPCVELAIRDTGVGIPADEIERVFERFHRVRQARSRSHEGTGIGLALVSELVKLHGGTIEVESEVDRGSCFTVVIPAGKAHLPEGRIEAGRALETTALSADAFVDETWSWLEDSPAPAERTPAPAAARSRAATAAAAPTGRRRERLLVVDDNADMRAYLRALLAPRWDVELAPDGAEALRAVARSKPDLVLSDIMMPNVDGLELVAALRGSTETVALPVILLSARAGEEETADGLHAGANDYIVKPFAARELVARVQAQLALANAREETRRMVERERERLRDLLMRLPASVALLRGPDHVYELANDKYAAIVGRPVDELVGRPGRVALPELVEQGIWDIFDRIRATGEPFETAEFPVSLDRRGDGRLEPAWFTWRAQAIAAGRGDDEDRILIHAIEVTELVRSRTEIDAARAAAEAANSAKDEFLAMLGHELRNPLAPIATALHLMKRRDETAHARERAIIERQLGHVTRLVDDLLDIARITRGAIELRRAPHELATIVSAALETMGPMLATRGRPPVVDVPARGLLVEVDTTRIAQVIANLVHNAVKFTPPDRDIKIAAARDGGDVVLRVIDDGAGIPAALLPHVFEPFVQQRQSSERRGGGLGLGLAIAKSLVEAHGGSLTARNPGHGTEIELRLPAVRAVDGAADDVAAAAAEPDRRRILVVDDNIDAADLLAEALRDFGHDVDVAYDAADALRKTKDAPDVALLDLGLPVTDGYVLAAELRRRFGERVRLFAVSGYGQDGDRRRSAAAGFEEHLTKPVDIERIASLLTGT